MGGLRQRVLLLRFGRTALSTAMFAVLLGCQAPPPRVAVPVSPPTPPAALPQADESNDWHGLLIVPLGSALKDVPIKLHEVLLFRDEARSGDAVAEAECYGADAPAAHFFLGRTPDEYLLCFKQDRLSRIQASLRLPLAQASEVFRAACAGWLQRAAPATPGPDIAAPVTTASAATAPATAAPSVGGPSIAGADIGAAQAACEGRDGAIRYSGRLGKETGEEQTPETELTLSITLDSDHSP
jgi:hypothetical protein